MIINRQNRMSETLFKEASHSNRLNRLKFDLRLPDFSNFIEFKRFKQEMFDFSAIGMIHPKLALPLAIFQKEPKNRDFKELISWLIKFQINIFFSNKFQGDSEYLGKIVIFFESIFLPAFHSNLLQKELDFEERFLLLCYLTVNKSPATHLVILKLLKIGLKEKRLVVNPKEFILNHRIKHKGSFSFYLDILRLMREMLNQKEVKQSASLIGKLKHLLKI